MSGWFSGPKKKKKESARPVRPKTNSATLRPPGEIVPARPPKHDPQLIAERLGGAENIAKIVKAILAEDRLK